MVRGLHFVNAGKYAAVSYDVMRYIGTVLNGRVIANIAGNDGAVSDAGGNAEIVLLKQDMMQRPYAHKTEKGRVADERRIEGTSYKERIPVGTGIIVFDKYFPLFRSKVPPGLALS